MAVSDSDFTFDAAPDLPASLVQDQLDLGSESIHIAQKLLQLTSDVIAIYDLAHEHLICQNHSLALLLGYTNTDHIDEKIILHVVLHPDDISIFAGHLEQMKFAGDEEIGEITYRLQHANGLWRLFSVRTMIYKRHADGSVEQVLMVARDITEQHESAARLQADNALKLAQLEQAAEKIANEREKMQALSHFVGRTGHELRTPLTIITTSLYLLKKMNDPLKQAERLQIVENQVAQLSRLISQMHILMKLDSIHQPITPVTLSLNTLLTKLEQDMASAIARKELIFELDFADDLPAIQGDLELVVIALRNVLENAILYSDSGTIRAQTTSRNNQVILSVTDTGIGIQPEDLAHIFERFYKVETDKKNARVAAGLGLAIVKCIMELHGGSITAESEFGRGSVFTLVWPL